MPRGDGTGPRGRGPKTGRRLGRCNSDRKEFRFKDREYGGGFGQGHGLGIDRGRGPGGGRGRGSGRRNHRNQ